MQGRNGSAGTKPNIWVALAGVALVIALAVGLLSGGADARQSAASGGYGGGGNTGNGNPTARCSQGGYATACPAQVSHLSNKPAEPKRGRGFKVSFKSKSGGAYSVVVIRKTKSVTLETGSTGTGETTTHKVGKSLKAGKYQLRVTVNTGSVPDVAKKSLTIRK